MRVGLRGVARSGEALVGGGVWCVALRESGAFVPRWRAAVCGGGRRRGTGDIVACVASRGTAEVVAGAPALRESGACGPFERDECLRPLGWARGAASVRLGAVRGVPPRGETRQMPPQRSGPLVPRPQLKNAVARALGHQ